MRTATAMTTTGRRGVAGWVAGIVVALLMTALALAPPVATVRAATDTVRSCSGDPAVMGSLPAVLAAAGAGDTIIFAQDCTGANAITPTDTLTPTVNVTIDGTGHQVTISGYNTVQLFQVNSSGVTLGLTGLILTGGTAVNGGGAIANDGTVTITNSTLSGNSTASFSTGGAIYNGGTLMVTNSTLGGNTAFGGGAIYNGGTATITNSTLSGNTAFGGGAIQNTNIGTLTVTNSTLSGNTATNNGGAITNFGTATITGSTLSGNTADRFGGAIYNYRAPLSLTLSVVADNSAPTGFDIDANVTTDGGGNVVGNTAGSSGLTNATDRLNVPALLAPLAVYAPGTVQTFALLPGSPAIDILACPAGLTSDARGVSRPQGTLCDAGSFESRGFTTGTLTGNNQNAPINTGFTNPVGFTVSDANREPVAGGQITFTITPGSSGASAAFGTAPAGCTVTSGTVAVCTMGMNGTVASPTFTANGTAGSFTIVATASGVPTTTFTETNGVLPVAANDSYTVVAGSTLTVPAATGVFANDTPGTPTATVTANTQATHGSVTLNADGSFVYRPAAGYVGNDSFTYTITNSVGSSTGTVNLTVTGTAPTASNDGPYTVTTGTTLTVGAATGVLANDPRGNPTATISGNTQATHGTLMFNTTDGSFVYRPTSGYVGNDSFTYTITNSVGTSTGTVNISVVAATVTGLSTVAPTGTGSGNSGTASAPTLLPGGTLTLMTTGTYNNGTSGTLTSGLTYTSSNTGVATVNPATGVVTANTAGQVTITVSGPNGTRTAITVTVTGAAGTGLMPAPQPMTPPGVAATGASGTGLMPLPQPGRH